MLQSAYPPRGLTFNTTIDYTIEEWSEDPRHICPPAWIALFVENGVFDYRLYEYVNGSPTMRPHNVQTVKLLLDARHGQYLKPFEKQKFKLSGEISFKVDDNLRLIHGIFRLHNLPLIVSYHTKLIDAYIRTR